MVLIMKKSKMILSAIMAAILLALQGGTPVFALEFNSTKFVVSSEIWNLDFENVTFNSAIKPPYVYLYDVAGKRISNSFGDFLNAHTGSNESIITSEDNTMGKCMSLQTKNTADKVQLNEFFITVTKNIAMVEYDFLVHDYNTSKTVMSINYNDSSGTARWANQLTLSKDGEFSFVGNTHICEIDKWYQITQLLDLDTDTISCFIDGDLLDSAKLAYDAVKTNRVSLISNPGAETICCIDNFRVCELETLPMITEVTNGENYIDFTFDCEVDNFHDNIVNELQISYKENVLHPVSFEKTGDNTARVVTMEKVFTSVPITIEMPYKGEIIQKEVIFAPNDFDVVSVNFMEEGGKIGAEAVMQNLSAETKTAVMLMVLYDENGNIVGVRSSEQTVIEGNNISVVIPLSESVSKRCRVFIIKDYRSCVAVKNVIYQNF